MFKNLSKSKKIFIIVCFSIIILSVVYGVYFFFWKNKKNANTQPSGLTEEQRAIIIKDLTSGGESLPITAKEREQITKDLTSNSETTKPLTNDERQTILDTLNQ